jgi:hypothetical protein
MTTNHTDASWIERLSKKFEQEAKEAEQAAQNKPTTSTMNHFKAIERREITNTLPVGILEDGLFTPDSAGLAVRLSGFYTAGELAAILQDLQHVNTVYQSKQ